MYNLSMLNNTNYQTLNRPVWLRWFWALYSVFQLFVRCSTKNSDKLAIGQISLNLMYMQLCILVIGSADVMGRLGGEGARVGQKCPTVRGKFSSTGTFWCILSKMSRVEVNTGFFLCKNVWKFKQQSVIWPLRVCTHLQKLCAIYYWVTD